MKKFKFDVVNNVLRKGEKLPVVGDRIHEKRMEGIRNNFEAEINQILDEGPVVKNS